MADLPLPHDSILRALETVPADCSVMAEPLSAIGSALPTTERAVLRISPPHAGGLLESTEPADNPPPRPALLSTLGSALPEALPDLRGYSGRSETSYELLKRIGAGGQGEVWRGIQKSLQREVAVKILTSGGHEEFLREAFTSGALDHPNIVPAVDLGRAEIDGVERPMLAMKLVRGRPWNSVLYHERPAADEPMESFLAAQLRVFLAVCNAVEFAHSRGVIHRDLKPSQVMVGEFGEVYLVDWGMAVCIDTQKSEIDQPIAPRLNTLATATNPAGTPAYMAPEQTFADTSGLGIHTDIYLLGGLLRELVTGGPPHEAQFGRASMLEARANSLRPLPDFCPSELRHIIDAAMATDPAKRPMSVRAIRTVIEDYLTGAGRQRESRAISEEVTAHLLRIPAGGYAAFVQAERRLSHALELWPGNTDAQELRQRVYRGYAEAALKAGDLQLCDSLILNLKSETEQADIAVKVAAARHELARAEAMQRRQQWAIRLLVAIVLALSVVGIARERSLRSQAERNLLIARTHGKAASRLVSFVLRDLKKAMDKELMVDRGISVPVANAIAHAVAGEVATPIVEYYHRLQDRDWPMEMRLDLAYSRREDGARFQEMARLEESLALTLDSHRTFEELLGPAHPDTIASLVGLGHIYKTMDDNDKAREQFQRTLEVRESTLGPDHVDTAQSLTDLGNVLVEQEQFDRGNELLRRALTIREDQFGRDSLEAADSLEALGEMFFLQSRYEDAEPYLERVLAIRESKAEPESDILARAQNNMAVLYRRTQRIPDAEPLYRRAIAIQEKTLGPWHPELATTIDNLGSVVFLLNRPEEATDLFERALAIRQKSFGERHPETRVSLDNLITALTKSKEFDQAERYARTLMEIERESGPADSLGVVQAKFRLANTLLLMQRFEESIELTEEVIREYTNKRGALHPSTNLARAQLATLHHRSNNLSEAERIYREILADVEESEGLDSRALAPALNNLSNFLQETGRLEESRQLYERMLRNREAALGPDHLETAYSRKNLARVLIKMNRLEEAKELLTMALAIFEREKGVNPNLLASTRQSLQALEQGATEGIPLP